MVKLEKIDLKRNTQQSHPDIKVNAVHLVRINGIWYCGRFNIDERDNSLYFADSTYNLFPSLDEGFQEAYRLERK